MVYRDLSDIEKPQHASEKSTPAIAFVLDRFIALIFDFLIFSPVISLFGAGVLRQVKTMVLLNPTSSEAILLWGFLVVMMFVLTVLLQSVFLYFWQATPGQIFMQLRVISYPEEQGRLRYSQCIQRALFWTLSFGFAALPFLEILSHPLRRAFYDRAADTMVITLKKEHDEGPLALEVRYISSWTRMFFLVLLLIGTSAFFKSYNSLKVVLAKQENPAASAVATETCKDGRLESLRGEQRLDAALSLFLLNAVNSECLGKEADFVLWDSSGKHSELAYLAKAMSVADQKTQKSYQEKICQEDSSEVCRLSRVLLATEGKNAPALEASKESLLSTRVMAMENQLEEKDFVGTIHSLKELRGNASLTAALEKKYVRVIWSLQETKKTGRAPASQDTQDLIQEFKESYEVP
ncbi:RDD family protein [compost metagenome]